jgi:hypothetical protein
MLHWFLRVVEEYIQCVWFQSHCLRNQFREHFAQYFGLSQVYCKGASEPRKIFLSWPLGTLDVNPNGAPLEVKQIVYLWWTP